MAGGEGEGGKAEAEGEQIEGTQHSSDTRLFSSYTTNWSYREPPAY